MIPSFVQHVETYQPDSFHAENHFYPEVLHVLLHPMVLFFLSLQPDQWIWRYCHLRPQVDSKSLETLLAYQPKHFYWAGSDLFNVATPGGRRRMVVVETNSCPSGQKSMPFRDDYSEYGGYFQLVGSSFKPLHDSYWQEEIERQGLAGMKEAHGVLAVLYDKNRMENSGYAAAMATIFNEKVYLVPCPKEDASHPHEKHWRFTNDGILEIQNPDAHDEWLKVRACLRYVTQAPWNRIPLKTKTFIYNPVVACLAGGRNKLTAAKAYQAFNDSLEGTGLAIQYPETLLDITKPDIPQAVASLGGKAVVKIPYSNAGQGVFTITNPLELDQFMTHPDNYDQYIVQSLIGNKTWSSTTRDGQFFHIGTVPNRKCESFVADLRFMVCWRPKKGYVPTAMYARQARKHLDSPLETTPSWDILGTNLSVKSGHNQWDSETQRLITLGRRQFNTLGIGIDDMIEAYVQTLLSVIAIDQQACKLLNEASIFNDLLFQQLNQDPALWREIQQGNPVSMSV